MLQRLTSHQSGFAEAAGTAYGILAGRAKTLLYSEIRRRFGKTWKVATNPRCVCFFENASSVFSVLVFLAVCVHFDSLLCDIASPNILLRSFGAPRVCFNLKPREFESVVSFQFTSVSFRVGRLAFANECHLICHVLFGLSQRIVVYCFKVRELFVTTF